MRYILEDVYKAEEDYKDGRQTSRMVPYDQGNL